MGAVSGDTASDEADGDDSLDPTCFDDVAASDETGNAVSPVCDTIQGIDEGVERDRTASGKNACGEKNGLQQVVILSDDDDDDFAVTKVRGCLDIYLGKKSHQNVSYLILITYLHPILNLKFLRQRPRLLPTLLPALLCLLPRRDWRV